MLSCPKCGGYDIRGPRFVKRFNHESLRYDCAKCGYSEDRPTKDAAPPVTNGECETP